MKKRIVIVAVNGISIRNLFSENNELFNLIKKNYDIFVISSKKYKSSIPEHLNFLDIELFKLNIFDYFLNKFKSLVFYKNYYTNSHQILLRKPFFKPRYTKLIYLISKIIPKSRRLYDVIDKIQNIFIHLTHFNEKKTIKKINPHYLISLNPLSPKEGLVINLSNKLSKTAGVIKSFDNITTNGYMPTIPQKLFVWNEFMKYSAIKAYKKNKKDVFCVGSSQFDFLKDRKKSNNNNNNKINKSRIILYCTNSIELYPGDRSNIEYLLKFAEKYDFYLRLRFHQCDKRKRWFDLTKSHRLKLSNYESFNLSNSEERISSKNHLSTLDKDIKDSLFIISSYSTLIYDSLTRNKPCINLGFDPYGTQHKYPVSRLEEFEHIIPLLKCKYVINTNSQSDLLEKILYLLENYKNFIKIHRNNKNHFIERHLGENKKQKTLENIIDKLGIKINY